MNLRRRRFLGLAAGAAAGTAVGRGVGHVMAGVLAGANSDLYPPSGRETFALSVCQLCSGGCGLKVRRIGKRVVKVDGNPLHPVNGGRLCPRGQAAIQGLYHPDRIPGPMRRVGPRGNIASFQKATWQEALDALAARLKLLRDGHRPEALVLLRGRSRDIGSRLLQRFLAAFGSPNDVSMERGDEAAALATLQTQGVRAAPAYDIQSSYFVLSLGGAFLEGSSSPVHTMRAFGRFRQVRTGRRGKLVQVEPRLSATATAADEWVDVRPGTEGIFGLGVCSVIVSEGLFDKTFAAEHTEGLEDRQDENGPTKPGLRSLLEKSFELERVAALTGVPVNSILRVAREFAASRRSLAVGGRRGPLVPGSTFDHLVASTLNALVGNIDDTGGTLLAEEAPLPPWPDPPPDPVRAEGMKKERLDGAGSKRPLLLSDPEQLSEALISGSPYAADVLLLLGVDPLVSSAAPARFAAALDRVPMVVSFSSMPDDTALHADWILPEAHFLERWDLHLGPASVAYPVVSLAKPALSKPLQDVRPVGDLVLELAGRLGLSAALPWKDVAALLRAETDGLYRAQRGAIMGTPFDEAWVRMMERAGWAAPGYRTEEELWQKAQETGGWWDPFYDQGDFRRVLRTASGRYTFRADLLSAVALPQPASEAAPSREGEGGEALALVLFEPLAIMGGVGAELPFLQGILDPALEESWETWAEIHPETAARLSVRDGDHVRLTSGSGTIVARTRVTERIVTGAIGVPVGLGRRDGGRWAAGAGSNPLALLSESRDPLSGLPDFGSTTVRLAVVEPEAARMVTLPERKG